jgi:hypothetical protein
VSKPPSWNEIRANARAFVARWEGTTDENAEAQTFWNEFLAIFGVDRKRVASFEARAKRTSTGGRGRIDLLWPGTLVAEHKSTGKDLGDAEDQALDYLESIDVKDFPGVVVTSDFAHFRVRDLGGDNTAHTFVLDQLPSEIDRFAFIAGYQQRKFGDQDEVAANIAAAKLMARLYEELSINGYEGHDASILLTRALFLLFGDDTGMWEKDLFAEFIGTRTSEDGSDLGPQLAFLFQMLDTPEDSRSGNTDELILRFPYVNGRLFTDRIDIPAFDKKMRNELVECCDFDWGSISPAVFGSLFQAVKSKEARRELGEHYTTEANILRLLEPLFLDDLRAEFEAAKNSKQKLERLHGHLADIKVFDPACGCGNFLVIAYRELRRLELAILTELDRLGKTRGQQVYDVTALVRVSLDHFYGIELEEWPARIAETAMFLVDQQANHELARIFGQAPDRLPIAIAANITVGNATRLDWDEILPAGECTYIVGNPPFIGMAMTSQEQQDDNRLVFADFDGTRTGRLDYVACWYAKAVEYMRDTVIRAAFVSTNSITQGEQAREMGPILSSAGYAIDFAHRTFDWSSEASSRAGVHVVIIGFSQNGQATRKRLFDYENFKGEPRETAAKSINFYLLDAPGIYPPKRTTPLLAGLPIATQGNKPVDGGHLLVTRDEYQTVAADPVAAKYLRLFRQGQDLLNGGDRWCLWLVDASPAELSASPVIRERLLKVAEERSKSKTPSVRAQAATPALFTQIRQPTTAYIAVPEVSSDRRNIVPAAYLPPDVVAGNKLIVFPDAPKWLFGILQSEMWSVWLRTFCGRLRVGISFSPDLTYCTFPFPEMNEEQKERLTKSVENILHVREAFPNETLAQLYDPLLVPRELSRAHEGLDSAVDSLYTKKRLTTSAERLEVLFARYSLMTSDLFTPPSKSKSKKK